MKFTIDWLKQHLDTKYNDEKIIDKLTNVGLEVESFRSQSSELDDFIVAKKIKLQDANKVLRESKKSRLPIAANNVYKDQWVSWSDFLASKYIPTVQRKYHYASYQKAKKHALLYGVSSATTWVKLIKKQKNSYKKIIYKYI